MTDCEHDADSYYHFGYGWYVTCDHCLESREVDAEEVPDHLLAD